MVRGTESPLAEFIVTNPDKTAMGKTLALHVEDEEAERQSGQVRWNGEDLLGRRRHGHVA